MRRARPLRWLAPVKIARAIALAFAFSVAVLGTAAEAAPRANSANADAARGKTAASKPAKAALPTKPAPAVAPISRALKPSLERFLRARPPALDAPKMQVHQAIGVPTPDPKRFPNAMTVARNGFVSVYDPDRRVPLVVSWATRPKDIDEAKRTVGFRSDPFHEDVHLPDGVPRATLADFRNSGYDRGHLLRQTERLDQKANDATFSLINIVPQARNNNAGPWAHLEEFYPNHVADGGFTAYVQAGSIFEGPAKTIGDGVAVPSHLYKIVVLAPPGLDPRRATKADIGTRIKVFAVVIPNNNEDVKLGDHWARFIVPVSEIAGRAKHDGFLSGLPEDVRATALAYKPTVVEIPKAEGTAYLVDGMFARAFAPKTSLAD